MHTRIARNLSGLRWGELLRAAALTAILPWLTGCATQRLLDSIDVGQRSVEDIRQVAMDEHHRLHLWARLRDHSDGYTRDWDVEVDLPAILAAIRSNPAAFDKVAVNRGSQQAYLIPQAPMRLREGRRTTVLQPPKGWRLVDRVGAADSLTNSIIPHL